MPKAVSHQASGLLNLRRGHAARLAPLVRHGDTRSESRLLHMLCAALCHRGWNVTVLDGSQTETKRTPGLLQSMEGRGENAVSTSQTIEPWLTLPARLGLHELAQQGHEAWSDIWPCQGQHDLPSFTLVYASADQLAPLCLHLAARPLLSLSEERSSLLTSYLAIKRLLMDTGITASVVEVTDHQSAPGAAAQRQSNLLIECTRNYLQVDLDIPSLQWADMRWPGSIDFNAMVDSWIEESVTLVHPRWIPVSTHAVPIPASLGARIT